MSATEPTAKMIYDTCACLGVQRAARALARRYDEALAHVGLTSGQFAILSALLRDAPVPLTELAILLGLDRTTLTRNLAPLAADGLVGSAAASDRRVRALAITRSGRSKLDEAMPLWRAAQADSDERLGGDWAMLRPALARLS